MDNDMKLNPIKAARLAAGYTQQQVNDALGIPLRTLTQWETGRRTPPEYVQRMYMFFWPTKRRWITYKKGLTLRQALTYAAISRRWMVALIIVCIFGIVRVTSTRSCPIVEVDWWNKKQRIVFYSTILCFYLQTV